jgi:catechol 2,3-dioxygenase-like lactoylglutathione lyase family enzyme
MSDQLKAFQNLGVRAPNMEAELAFLESFGASEVTKTERMHEGQKVERFHLHLGSTKLTLFRRATYDDALEALGEPRGGGIGHVAFEITDTAAIVRALAEKGIRPLIPTFETPPGKNGPAKRVTYFRSPNGTVVETQEVIG